MKVSEYVCFCLVHFYECVVDVQKKKKNKEGVIKKKKKSIVIKRKSASLHQKGEARRICTIKYF